MAIISADCFRGLDQRDQLTALYEVALELQGGGSEFDPDAEAFFTRMSITDTTEKQAVNQLVLELKAEGWYGTKVFNVYPLVGNDPVARTANLIDPAMDGFPQGGMTFPADGAKGNGTDGFIETFWDPSATAMSATAASFFCYINQADASGGAQMGTPTAGAANNVFQFFSNLSGNSYYFGCFGTNTGKLQGANAGNTTGSFIGSRTATGLTLYRNGASVLSSVNPSENSPPALPPYLFARNNGGLENALSDCAMGIIGYGLDFSAAEAATLNTIITNFITTLGRL